MSDIFFPHGERLLSDYVKKYAEEMPQKVAINYYGREITYQELDELSDRLAAGIADMGYQKGERIALLVQSCALSIGLYLAAMKLGLIVVPVDPMSKEFELEYFLMDSGARLVGTMDTLYPNVMVLKERCALRDVITLSFRDYFPETPAFAPHKMMLAEKQTFRDAHDCWGLIEASRPNPPRTHVQPSDIGYILYTGGTTGWPKGCLHSHRDLLLAGLGQGQCNFNGGAKEDIMLSSWPVTHISGLTLSIAVPLANGMTGIPLARWDAKAAMTAITKYKVTLVLMVVPSYYDIMNHPEVKTYDFHSLRVNLMIPFGMPITDDILEKWEEITGCPVFNWGYGSSENMNYGGYGWGLPMSSRPVCTGFGRPFPGVRVKILDWETGKELPEGEEGEIVTQGPAHLREYWNKPEENKRDIVQGWLHTHDRGYVKDGVVYFLGKASDVVKVSGYTISLKEIELFGIRHPAIEKIAVIAVPHPRKGNELKAFVTLKPGAATTAAAIEEWFKSKVAAFKCPQVEIREEIPLSGKGDILKRVLLEETRPGKKGNT
jgi:long-chain acyl-CoA synthetase